ncbi:MAG: tetratricopeptide repeat protein [Phycisphaerales bacterium]|nr:tetratricopeptide repeat protein [Phycisphaerales bacterium]
MPTIAQLKKLLTLDPNDPFVHYGLGQEHASVGDHEQAIACYDKVLELDPEYLYAYFFKGQALHDSGKTDEAKLVIQSGIEAARKINDGHAASELSGLLDSIT